MALMIPRRDRASMTSAFVVQRKFRMEIRCNECEQHAVTEIALVDEPREPGSVEGFYGCDAMERMGFECRHCGGRSATILRTLYVRQPMDGTLQEAA